MMTNEMIQNTFIRLGLTAPDEIRPTKDLLFAVQYTFTQTVPYENIDILHGMLRKAIHVLKYGSTIIYTIKNQRLQM